MATTTFAATIDAGADIILRGDGAIPERDRFEKLHLTRKGRDVYRRAIGMRDEQEVRRIVTAAVATGY